jgi:uncharacterized repeat protein (TIGR03803 family)
MAISTWKSAIRAARPKIADWLGQPDADTVSYNGGLADTALPAAVPPARHPALTTLASFGGPDGSRPEADLIFDAAGDLFGTTGFGGPSGFGTVFEIANNGGGYASAPTTIGSFTGTDGKHPFADLITDAAGDLFGTTYGGGANRSGTVFEIANTGGGYASAPTTLVTFSGADGKNPECGLITDAAGDLFGTTLGGGPNGDGTVFEIAKTQDGYASAPTTLVSFDFTNGENPAAGLIADSAGDLFGTTVGGGANGNFGTVFEIVKTTDGYASAPTTLVSFTGHDGYGPVGGLMVDTAGDLFGTTYGGGANGYGTVFEIAKTADGYASTPTTLVSFTSSDGAGPQGSLIIDAAGDLFGTTYRGGTDGYGTVFEIAKTYTGYASAPTTLVNFTVANGAYPDGALATDAAGNLYGTTVYGGKHNEGTVFEITNSGFVVSPPTAAFAQALASHGAGASGSTSVAALATPNEAPTLISSPRGG